MNGVGQDIELGRNLIIEVGLEDTMKSVGVLMRKNSSGLIDVERGIGRWCGCGSEDGVNGGRFFPGHMTLSLDSWDLELFFFLVLPNPLFSSFT